MLNREKGAQPLYFQLENLLREEIEQGNFIKGEIFPTEKNLQELYNVSRVTVRQAISALVNRGYLQCQRGIGTTVIFEKIDENLKHQISFTDEMRQHGIVMETSSCEIKLTKPNKTVARKLELSEDELCYELIRVRCAKGIPIVYSVTYLKKKYELSLDKESYMESLYQFLKEQYKISIVRVQDTLEAVIAQEETGRFLQIDMNKAVFKRTRKAFDEQDELFEYSICYYPGDKYQYSVDLSK